jgi:hypothetical protein
LVVDEPIKWFVLVTYNGIRCENGVDQTREPTQSVYPKGTRLENKGLVCSALRAPVIDCPSRRNRQKVENV